MWGRGIQRRRSNSIKNINLFFDASKMIPRIIDPSIIDFWFVLLRSFAESYEKIEFASVRNIVRAVVAVRQAFLPQIIWKLFHIWTEWGVLWFYNRVCFSVNTFPIYSYYIPFPVVNFYRVGTLESSYSDTPISFQRGRKNRRKTPAKTRRFRQTRILLFPS